LLPPQESNLPSLQFYSRVVPLVTALAASTYCSDAGPLVLAVVLCSAPHGGVHVNKKSPYLHRPENTL
jgi:hypothetical protein